MLLVHLSIPEGSNTDEYTHVDMPVPIIMIIPDDFTVDNIVFMHPLHLTRAFALNDTDHIPLCTFTAIYCAA